jgi:exopolyphosphatase/guanosine-5'-triphosphate,3'-diphosphate pyrophosphatase
MKLAALDLGSNSFHLLVAETSGGRELRKVGSHKEMLRLGSVVERHGRLSDEAFAAALDSVSRMASVAAQLGATKLVTVATSALRDARNGQAFGQACHERLGVTIELLSGNDEARLAYSGARSAFGFSGGRMLVADLGGRSLELAAGSGLACEEVRSLPLGFLRLYRAFPLHEAGGARRLARYVQLECERARFELGRFESLLLSGGTARAIGKLLGGGNASADTAQVIQLCDALAELSPAQLRLRGVEEARSSTLAAGAAVMSGLLVGLGEPQLRISPRGLREGVILRELGPRAVAAA